MTIETIAARVSSERRAGRVAWLNVALVLMTGALVALTIVLALKK